MQLEFDMQQFEVSAEWMAACGLTRYNPVMTVIRIDDHSLVTPSAFFGRMVIVKHPYLSGTWTVAIGRGRFI